MQIFYDTEFHEDGKTIDLISIGMVREDGREYYAVSAEADYRRASLHPWLRANVLCYLPMLGDGKIDMSSDVVKSRTRIRDEVRAFVLGVEDPQLWAWYGAYDHVALAQLFGPMVNLPPGFPMWTNDLRQEVQRYGNPPMPVQTMGLHNALSDAHHLRDMAMYLMDDEEDSAPVPVVVELPPMEG